VFDASGRKKKTEFLSAGPEHSNDVRWRESEARGVQLRQVHEDGWIRLDPQDSKEEWGKGIPYADIPVLARSIGYCLREHEKLRADNIVTTQLFVWWTTKGRRKRGNPVKSWRGAYNSGRTNAGCPQRLMHDFRRTAARIFSKAGVPKTTAMAITGHQTESMWTRYNIQTETDIRDAFARNIQRAVRGSSTGSRTISAPTEGKAPVRLEVVSRGKKRA